ncbi:hypothetical protein SRHO_G00019920 [Serrasalmus rhombeus]
MDVERAEESQARQQPAAGEKESNAPHVPAGLESGSLETISSVMLEKLRTPLHEDLQIEAEAEPKAIKPLMYTDLDEKDADNNQPLGCEVMNVTDTEPEAPTLTMQTYSDEVDTPNDHPLEWRVESWWHSTLGKGSLAPHSVLHVSRFSTTRGQLASPLFFVLCSLPCNGCQLELQL